MSSALEVGPPAPPAFPPRCALVGAWTWPWWSRPEAPWCTWPAIGQWHRATAQDQVWGGQPKHGPLHTCSLLQGPIADDEYLHGALQHQD